MRLFHQTLLCSALVLHIRFEHSLCYRIITAPQKIIRGYAKIVGDFVYCRCSRCISFFQLERLPELIPRSSMRTVIFTPLLAHISFKTFVKHISPKNFNKMQK